MKVYPLNQVTLSYIKNKYLEWKNHRGESGMIWEKKIYTQNTINKYTADQQKRHLGGCCIYNVNC